MPIDKSLLRRLVDAGGDVHGNFRHVHSLHCSRLALFTQLVGAMAFGLTGALTVSYLSALTAGKDLSSPTLVWAILGGSILLLVGTVAHTLVTRLGRTDSEFLQYLEWLNVRMSRRRRS